MKPHSPGKRIHSLFLSLFLLLGASGCIATRGWVQEQITPLRGQVTEVETRLNHTETQAELALKNLEHLRLERHLVLGVNEGANFAVASANLTAEAMHAIDTLLETLPGANDVIFVVTGHTDSIGSEDYNFALGQKRASNVAHYLITRKGIDPLRVTVVSYGERAPMEGNATSEGRYKNRRVEIQVYRETIASAPGRQRLELERTSGG